MNLIDIGGERMQDTELSAIARYRCKNKDWLSYLAVVPGHNVCLLPIRHTTNAYTHIYSTVSCALVLCKHRRTAAPNFLNNACQWTTLEWGPLAMPANVLNNNHIKMRFLQDNKMLFTL